MDEHYIYIVKCSDDTLYTGYTTDLEKRLAVHNAGKGAKYTKNRLPVTRIYSEQHPTKSEAMKREYAIKQLTRNEKLKLIKEAAHEYALSGRNTHRQP
ncbi:GIY-YIG nuclease family protein [Macrococcus lamae]|uniref:GIY-YIG nuclease family protein n=1 Tax=Macrococcus lamae TaxID=198484 RepID=A0A4R6BSL5_9STAP|nr:GIY-YIG nuclease family protein [Macrococcus lamae]TDM07212.1 GIY-YIG nuclease family protein [Macrococcus lamae]